MSYTLPPLPYAYAALEPHIDTRTMEIHHDKHHAAYINNLNNALKDHPELAAKPVNELIANLSVVPENIRTAVRNNGGGHSIHTFFWELMGPGKGGEPVGARAEALTKTTGHHHRRHRWFGCGEQLFQQHQIHHHRRLI